jgi:HSP20 family molecular chaperone IbpA
MDYLYQLALDPADIPLDPQDETPRVVCQYVHTPNAEVTEYDDEVVVTVDTGSGTGNSRLSVELVDLTTLVVTREYTEEPPGSTPVNIAYEQQSISRRQIIPLPVPVKKYGARLSLIHGILDIRLKRSQPIRI